MRSLLNELHRQIFDQFKAQPAREDWARVPQAPLGDLAFPCFKLSKELKLPPPQVAQNFLTASKVFFESSARPHSWIERIEAKGPYLNLFVHLPTAWSELSKRLPQKFFPAPLLNENSMQTVVIDFSSPNVAKEMGLHHLRSTALGHSLKRITEASGHKAVGLNYLGDWGTSFGKLLLGLEKFGMESELEKQGLPYMLDLYVKFNQAEKSDPNLSEAAKSAFQKLEAGDAEYTRLWKLFREISIREFKKIYERIGVEFDFFDGESFYTNKLEDVVNEIDTKIGTRTSEGALVCDLPGSEIPVLLKKDDGASLYITRDFAAIEDRWYRFHFDQAWYVVAVQQKLHFEQLFGVVGLLKKEYAGRAEHVSFGMLQFGSKTMKSREGNILFLKDVLDEAESRALKIVSEKNSTLPEAEKIEIARKVGPGALLYADLSQHRNHDVKFDWDKALSFEGDTAPFIQYTYARCGSLLEKVQAQHGNAKSPGSLSYAETQSFCEQLKDVLSVREVIKEILFFETYLEKAFEDKDPSQIAKSLIDLARAMNRLYHEVRFVDETNSTRREGLVHLTHMVRSTLKTGLWLLGIDTVERM